MSSGNTHPNFFLLLGLNPDERWEEARFTLLKDQKRREWSRDSTGIGSKADNARIYLSLLSKIQQVMSDPVEREREAAEARKELVDKKKARLEKFEQQFLRAQSKGFLEDGEVKAFVKDFADVLTEAELRKRAAVPIQAAPSAPNKPDLLEASIAKEIAQKLEALHLQTLYELLSRPPTHSRTDLKVLAEQLYSDMVKRPPVPETTLKMQLAGQGIKIFATDVLRAKYDTTLHQARIDALLKDLEEIIGRTTSKEVHESQVKKFLEDANRCGWKQNEALAELKTRAQTHKWTLITPAPTTALQQRCGNCNYVNTLPRNFCQNCNAELNLNCPNCGHPVAADTIGCGNCGFKVGDRFWVNSTLIHCQQLLARKNISEMQDLLNQLEMIWKPRTRDPYRQRIETCRAEFDKIVKDQQATVDTEKKRQQKIKTTLEGLFKDRKFYEARQFLSTQPPTLSDRGLYQRRIDTALADVQKVLTRAHLAQATYDERIASCEQALLLCVDCQEAKDFVKTLSPPAPLNLQASEKDAMVTLSWKAPSTRTLDYRIVRKKRSNPRSPTDGDVLQTVKGLVYDDLVPDHAIGVPLYYAVYAEYGGALSTQPVLLSRPAFLLQEVTNLNTLINHKLVELSWTSPQNVQTIVLLRKEGQNPGSFDDPTAERVGEYGKNQQRHLDRDVEDDRLYHYTLYCQFRDHNGSLKTTPGVSIRAKPEGSPEPPDKLALIGDEKDSHKVCIKWSQPQKGEVVIIRSQLPLPYTAGEVVSETALDPYGIRLVSRSTSLVDSWTQPGLFYYTPVVIYHQNAYMGETQRYACVENVRDLRFEMASSALRLYWTWPEQCERVIIYFSNLGWPLTKDLSPASLSVNRSVYEHIGYYDLAATVNLSYFLLVATVMKIGDEHITAQGVPLETRLIKKMLVTYEIHKPTLFRKRYTLHITSETPGKLPAFWLVSKRDRLPMLKDEGEVALRIGPQMIGSHEVVIDIPDHYPPNTFGKLFLEDDKINDLIKVQQPILEKLRLS